MRFTQDKKFKLIFWFSIIVPLIFVIFTSGVIAGNTDLYWNLTPTGLTDFSKIFTIPIWLSSLLVVLPTLALSYIRNEKTKIQIQIQLDQKNDSLYFNFKNDFLDFFKNKEFFDFIEFDSTNLFNVLHPHCREGNIDVSREFKEFLEKPYGEFQLKINHLINTSFYKGKFYEQYKSANGILMHLNDTLSQLIPVKVHIKIDYSFFPSDNDINDLKKSYLEVIEFMALINSYHNMKFFNFKQYLSWKDSISDVFQEIQGKYHAFSELKEVISLYFNAQDELYKKGIDIEANPEEAVEGAAYFFQMVRICETSFKNNDELTAVFSFLSLTENDFDDSRMADLKSLIKSKWRVKAV